ncbi:hypothetical protein [Actinomadura napierensis]|uniref:Uncharacterized protein n=1 Tax=Actinomadura napierensis TaxID=267854 RepID=A0ABN3ADP5_9ACTN
MGIDERDVRRTAENLDLRRVAPAPASYASRTDRPVRYLAVGTGDGVLGYLWTADGEDAAGFVRRPAAGGDGANEAVAWTKELRAAKTRDVPAARLLDEFAAAELPVADGAWHPGRVIPGSRTEAPSLAALKELAARD